MTELKTVRTGHPVLAPGVAAGERFAHVRAMYESDRMSQSLGITITELTATDGTGAGEAGTEVRGNFVVEEWMCNGHGTVQGGVITTFADALFAGVCNAPGQTAVASQLSVHFVSPARVGDTVEGHAVARASWGRNGVTDVAVTCGGRLVAEFRGTSRVVPSV